MYKVLSKLLANRLRKVMHQIILDCQSAFIKNRQIMDGTLIANELVDEAKSEHKETFLFKVDFENTFDLVS